MVQNAPTFIESNTATVAVLSAPLYADDGFLCTVDLRYAYATTVFTFTEHCRGASTNVDANTRHE